ncbi:MAG: hypothetical protein ABI684_04640 [Nitrospirota bacterium]
MEISSPQAGQVKVCSIERYGTANPYDKTTTSATASITVMV